MAYPMNNTKTRIASVAMHSAMGDQPDEIETADLIAKRDALLALTEQAA